MQIEKTKRLGLVGKTIIIGTVCYLFIRTAKAEPPLTQEGLIIAIATETTGDCNVEACVIGKEITINSIFRNIGTSNKTNKIGIMVDTTVIKEEVVTLIPSQEYVLTSNFLITEQKNYDICGLVIE